ncbi:uncharacterized mitochondrial protein AtMg00810-like [Cryptomeria japonica]|uniref:uncharacterized mitochondrial protein AtMg00810-like n=1 Tax=Cryptomeria japonica TaxID=3369 RepID=UPI0027DA3E0D|nr:uncharacterized mitochondrial protein AtMg00810-like [Cryptomeria japonica]
MEFCISQSKYVKKMLKKFGFSDCKPVTTPLTIGCKLRKDDESPEVEQNKYRSMIGGILYLNMSKPNIMQAICLVSRFQANLKVTHEKPVKRFFQYLKGTVDYGLWY